MDAIRTTIEILFKKQNPERLIHKYYNSLKVKGVDKELFLATYSYENPDFYNRDEIENIYNIFESNWKKLENVKEDNIFNVLVNFTKDILTEDKGIPVCKYKMLLKWRELSYLLDEDILTTAHFAYKDFDISYDRTIFAWKPIISTDNNQIKEILKKGCAENHFHLKGSAPHFQLAWLSLMNDINGRDVEFKKVEKETRLSPDVNFKFDEYSLDIKSLIKKAAAIRIFLFDKIILGNNSSNPKLDSICDFILKGKTNSDIKLFISDLQTEINKLKYTLGKKFENSVADYAIPLNISKNNYNKEKDSYNGNILLYGERFFLYSIFKKIFEGNSEALKYKRLFHSYIVIKSMFRDELVQINNRIGFANFSAYQDRKSIFLGKEIYKKAVINMAINSSIADQNIDYLEARIAPESNYYKLDNEINKLDKDVNCITFSNNISNSSTILNANNVNDKNIHYYVIHFIKQQEKYDLKLSNLKAEPLNFKVRKNLKQNAYAISLLRKSSTDSKNRILGIDAANFEIGCRPEVFAQCFRYLRNYKIKNIFENMGEAEIFNLGITYHAGEDFLSIVDGLRAIDEAVQFLEYEQGDRIGHALALGVDAKKYFMDKNYTLILPKQIHLDNIAWMLTKIREYDIVTDGSIISELNNNFYRLYSEIYDNVINVECSPDIYYMAWKLRGDAPERYITGSFNNNPSITFWEKCSISNKKELEELRKNKKICSIYMNYHYNQNVKKLGMKSEEVKVNVKFIKLITELQYGLQKELACKNICIETNPSSNYVIGTFKRYDKHPITKFYNMGLNLSDEEKRNCPQLSVSINTDDQGVFATYLENEYALMALAMEKLVDENGEKVNKPMEVYEWLDKIRAMGLEQSFKRRNEE